jgi:hypothetical protein
MVEMIKMPVIPIQQAVNAIPSAGKLIDFVIVTPKYIDNGLRDNQR